MAYTKQTWADLPSKTTPINANRLTHIEDGIYNAAATADTAASTAGTAAANVGIVSGKVETLTDRVNGLDTAVSNKVDKVAGKGLSTNDYDNTDKGKVDSLGTASTKSSTSVVTDSSDLVESGAVYDVVKGSVGFVTTGKNLLNNTATNKSTSDISFTVNADKSVTINGTATANRILALNDNFDSTALAGCLANGLSNISGLSYRVTSNDYATTYQTIDEDDTAIIDNGSGLSFYIRVANGTVCNNVTIYPMIRRADIIDSTYEPYHASVSDSLTEKADTSVIAPVENGSTASQAYAVGSHAIRNGAFITWKNAKSQGEPIDDASDYTAGQIGDIVYLDVSIPQTTIAANGVTAINLGSNILFTNYDILNVSIMIGGASSYQYALAQWVYSTNDVLRVSIHNLDSENGYLWNGKVLLTLRIK